MAKADHVSTAIRAPVTGAAAKPSTTPVHAAYAELITTVGANPPRPIPLFADACNLEDRAEHLSQVLAAFKSYLSAILEDTAENVPGEVDLRQIDALLCDLASEVRGILQQATYALPAPGRRR